ncbi:MAG: hypothetical protein OXU69_15310 [Gemmatimonadota bacterium]|nr:hypothetical protein [Gemmatimonadota bacterium]MDE2986069.1 hypothetical protein [Gemmatimonadota bacterium]
MGRLTILMACLFVPSAEFARAHCRETADSRPPAAGAQEPGGPVLSGRVLIGDLPADSGTVVLHRVSAQSAGEIDSVAVGEGGIFEIRLPEASGDETDEVFFATIRYQEVLYIGEAVTARPEAGGPYVIQAYPAIPAGPDASARVRIRNLFVEPLDPGPGWAVADYFEVGNDTRATLVAGEHGPTWSHALPPEGAGFRVGQSELSAGTASFSDGRVHVSAAMPPGEHLYLFRYSISGDRFSVPMEGLTGSMELLIREPAGELAVSGLVNVPEVEIEGVRYRRFAGRDVAPSVVTVARGGTGGPLGSVPLAAVILTLALAGAGALVAARSQGARRRSPAGRARRAVLVAIAALDEERRQGRIPEDDHARRRTRLLAELDR